jgi:DNA-binding NarL/FixJ family response regulator
MSNECLRLVVADDRARSRRALSALLDTCPDITVVGQAANGAEAVDLVALEQPDVAILDVRMPVMDGLQATTRIKAAWPHVRVLALSMAAEAGDQAMAAGADGFVAKGDSAESIISAVRYIARP